MKRSFPLVFCFLLFAAFSDENDSRRPVVVARVNDSIITEAEVDELLIVRPHPTQADRRRAIRKLAEDRLLEDEAKRHGIRIPEEKITSMVEKNAKMAGGVTELAGFLRMRKMTMTDYRDEIRKRILTEHLYATIVRLGYQGKGEQFILIDEVSPAEIRGYYREHRSEYTALERLTFSRIALKWRTPAEKEARLRLAASLRRRIEKGGDFLMLARLYSEVIWREQRGEESIPTWTYRNLDRDNDLFSRKTMDRLFDEVGDEEISPVIEEGNTINLFRVERREKRKELSFEEAQHDIRLQLQSIRHSRNTRIVLSELVRRAYFDPADLFADLR